MVNRMFTILSPKMLITAGKAPGWRFERQIVANAVDFSSLLVSLPFHPENPKNISVPALKSVSGNGGETQLFLNRFNDWLQKSHPGYRLFQSEVPLKISFPANSPEPNPLFAVNSFLLPTENFGFSTTPREMGATSTSDKDAAPHPAVSLPAALVKIQDGKATEVLPVQIQFPDGIATQTEMLPEGEQHLPGENRGYPELGLHHPARAMKTTAPSPGSGVFPLINSRMSPSFYSTVSVPNMKSVSPGAGKPRSPGIGASMSTDTSIVGDDNNQVYQRPVIDNTPGRQAAHRTQNLSDAQPVAENLRQAYPGTQTTLPGTENTFSSNLLRQFFPGATLVMGYSSETFDKDVLASHRSGVPKNTIRTVDPYLPTVRFPVFHKHPLTRSPAKPAVQTTQPVVGSSIPPLLDTDSENAPQLQRMLLRQKPVFTVEFRGVQLKPSGAVSIPSANLLPHLLNNPAASNVTIPPRVDQLFVVNSETASENLSGNGQMKAMTDRGTEHRIISSQSIFQPSSGDFTNQSPQPVLYTVLMIMPPQSGKTSRTILPGTESNIPDISLPGETVRKSGGMVSEGASPEFPEPDVSLEMERFSKKGAKTRHNSFRSQGQKGRFPAGQTIAHGSASRTQTPVFRISTISTGRFTGEIAEIIHQTHRQLVQLPPGQPRQILIRLQPQHLGLLRIQLRLEKDGLKGKIETSSDDAARLIRLNMNRLTERLHSLGIHLQDFDVSFQQQFAAPNNLYKEWQENGKRKSSSKVSENNVVAMENEGIAIQPDQDSLVDMMI